MDKQEEKEFLAIRDRFHDKYGKRLVEVFGQVGQEIHASKNADDLFFFHEYLNEAYRQVHDEVVKAKIVSRDDCGSMN